MSNAQHTPVRNGTTWSVDPRGDGIYSVGEAMMRDARGKLSDDEDEANARLIASAPALLEALHLTVAELEAMGKWLGQPEPTDAERNATATIAEATVTA